MIKNFQNYRKLQLLADGAQWEKTYEDGGTARLAIFGKTTRKIVVDRFTEQEQQEIL